MPAFFAGLGFEATVKPWLRYCYGEFTSVELALTLDGLPLIGVHASAQLDGNGNLTAAFGPLWRLTPLGHVRLAPAEEVVGRLQRGPGLVLGDCYDPDCTLRTRGAAIGLAYATTGGLGDGHDHIPGGIVDRPPSQVLVPALRVPGASANPRATHRGVLAVSSAVLVDDPGQGDAAALADAAPTTAERSPACTTGEGGLTICASRLRPEAGTPVVLTVFGERYEPVGAARCDPLFSLGAGRGPQSFRSRSGTLITARVVATYDETGSYAITARAASRCREPSPGGGTEPEYDFTVELTVTVT